MKGFFYILVPLFLAVLWVDGICQITRYCTIPVDTIGTALTGRPNVTSTDFFVTSGIRAFWYTSSCAVRTNFVTNYWWNDLCYAYYSSNQHYMIAAGRYVSGTTVYAAVYFYTSYSSPNYYFYFGNYVYGTDQPISTNDKRGLAVWHAGTSNSNYDVWCGYRDLVSNKNYLTFSRSTSSSGWYYTEITPSSLVITDIQGPYELVRNWGPVFVVGYDSATGDGFLRGFYGYNGTTYGIYRGDSTVIEGGRAWGLKLVRDVIRDGAYYLFVAAGTKGLLLYRVTSDIYGGIDYSAKFTLSPVAQWRPESDTLDIRDVYVYRTNEENWWVLLANYATSPTNALIVGLDWYNAPTRGVFSEWGRVQSNGKKATKIWASESERRIAITYDR